MAITTTGSGWAAVQTAQTAINPAPEPTNTITSVSLGRVNVRIIGVRSARRTGRRRRPAPSPRASGSRRRAGAGCARARRGTARARRDVEAVRVEEEVEAARHVLAGGAGHRVEDDRRLLALEAVDGADAHAVGHALADAAHGEVVGRDDEDVVGDERRASSPSSSVTRRAGEQVAAGRGDRLGLLGAGLAAALVLDGERAQAGAGERAAAASTRRLAHAARERSRES